jgi:hypothetical protein
MSPHAVSGIHDEIATLGNRLASEIMPLPTPVEAPAEPAITEVADESSDVTEAPAEPAITEVADESSDVTEAPAEPAITEVA